MSVKKVLVPLMLGVAVMGTLAGTALLIDFETAPGRTPNPPSIWPRGTRVKRADNQNQIVVIAHPLCGCTEATLRELSDVSKVALSVLVFRPHAKSVWGGGHVWQLAQNLPGANAQWDDEGYDARSFGSSTSGTVLLYGPAGNLLFRGGITQSRGHTGANRGLSQLKQALQTGQPSSFSSPVFGCSLMNRA